MFTPSNRRQRLSQRLGDASTSQMIVGYNDDGSPIIVENTIPNGVTEDVPASVYITPSVDYIPSSVAITPSVQRTGSDNTAQIVAAVGNLVQGGITAYQAIQLQNMQIDRINRGLPPLTAGQMASIAPQIGVGIAPDTQNALLIGLLIAGGFVLVNTMAKRRKAA